MFSSLFTFQAVFFITFMLSGTKKVPFLCNFLVKLEYGTTCLSFLWCFACCQVEYFDMFLFGVLARQKVRYDILGVKVRNMKMNFNTGGTWHWFGQWTLMIMIFFIWLNRLVALYNNIKKSSRRWKIFYILLLLLYKATKQNHH